MNKQANKLNPPELLFQKYTLSIVSGLMATSIFLCLVSLTTAGTLQAAPRSVEFDSIRISFQLQKNTNRNEFHRFWDPGNGIEGSAETPFYYGIISGGIHYHAFKGKSSQYPDFDTFLYFIQWGKRFSFPYGFLWLNSVRAGSYLIRFKSKDLPSGERNITESELSFGMDSRISWSPNKNWQFNLSAVYLVVFTQKRLRLFYFSAGISYSFKTPAWLRTILK